MGRLAINYLAVAAIGVMTARKALRVSPATAALLFWNAGIDAGMIVQGRPRRSNAVAYDLPDATSGNIGLNAAPDFGRRMTVHIRPRGPARFIIEDRGPRNLIWFDAP